MSKFIEDNKLSPVEAMEAGLDAGAAEIRIVKNNGTMEVTNSSGSILLQAKNVPAGIWTALWDILEDAGEIVYRA